ncbi:MAG: TonB-dependent receptor plug domain-containing protein [Chitinophagaceae bacterium]
MRKLVSVFTTLLFCTMVAFSQTSPVSGQIKNEKGEPVPFATVKIKGSNTGVPADQNGNFTIQAAKTATIIISATSFDKQEISVSNRTTISVSLKATSNLQEVVVTALGQTRSRDKLGYSASTFRAEDVVRSAPVSALDGLQGRVAGADISTVGGQPGSSSKIILRGYSSLSTSGNSQALIIVDGVPFNNSRLGSFNDFLNHGGVDFGNGLNDLNPNDIDNISILKGAAATSLYGSRASNGVVLVTTKKGRSGKLTVDFTSSAVFSSVGKLPDFQNTFGQGWNAQHWKEENGSWGPKLDGKDRLWGSVVDNSRLIKPFSAVEDNVRDFYDVGKEINNNIAIRGGNETANFYMSYGNIYSDGILPSDRDVYRRNNISLRGQIKANQFTASASLNYINKSGKTANTDATASGSSTFENIIQTSRDIPIGDFRAYKNKFFDVDNYFTPYASNPYYSLFENGNTNQNDRVFGNIELGWDFSKAINIR